MQWPVYLFMPSWNFFYQYFSRPSSWLLSDITFVKTVIRGEHFFSPKLLFSDFILYSKTMKIESIDRETTKSDICKTRTRLKVEKDCEKWRKCWLPAFSPFPPMFPKGISTSPLIHCIYFDRVRSKFTELNDQNLLQIVIFKHGPEQKR